MDKREFKRELEHHKTQINSSMSHLQKAMEELNKSNYDFYDFIETNYFDLEERVTRLERQIKRLS